MVGVLHYVLVFVNSIFFLSFLVEFWKSFLAAVSYWDESVLSLTGIWLEFNKTGFLKG